MSIDLVTILKIIIILVAILLVVVVIIQPSKKTGLIGDTTDAEKRVKRGFELFLFRLTIFLIACLFILTMLVFILG